MPKILNNDQDKVQWPCNCRRKESYPLNGKFLHHFIVYKTEITTNTSCKEYYEMSEVEFEFIYNNHTQSFRHISHINDTELSKYLWTMNANRTDYHLKLSTKSYASRYKCGTRGCNLCLTEKMFIAVAGPKLLFNKKNGNDIKILS